MRRKSTEVEMGQLSGRKLSLHKEVSRMLPVAPKKPVWVTSWRKVTGASVAVLVARWGKGKRRMNPDVFGPARMVPDVEATQTVMTVEVEVVQ